MNEEKEQKICMRCSEEIKKETDGIQCDGVCDQHVHNLCAFLEESEVHAINENENIHYLCDKCQENSLKTINNKLNGIFEYLYKLDKRTKNIFDLMEATKSVCEKNVNTVQPQEQQTKKRDSDTISDKKEKNKSKERQATTDESDTNKEKQNKSKNNDKQKKNASVSKSSTERNERIGEKATSKKSNDEPKTRNNVRSEANEQRSNQPKQPKRTSNANKEVNNSDKNKSKQNKDETNKNSSGKYAIVIKPKQSQSSNKTIMDLNKKCNPNELSLNSVTKTKFGTVIIECSNAEQQKVIKQRIESKLAESYEISEKSPLSPKIKIFGITELLELSVLEDLLKRQNEVLARGVVKALKITKDIRDKNLFNAIVQLDKITFDKVMSRKKVLINWDSCIVKEHHSIMRCHQCAGFNHVKDSCKNELACGYCAKSHRSDECEENSECCINCKVANDIYELNLDVNHNVWSRKCEILKKKLEKVSKRTEYVENK